VGLAKDIMNEDLSDTLEYAKRKMKEYRRLLSIDSSLRYCSEIEEEKLMNSSASLIKELETYLKNNPEKTRSGSKLPEEITDKINELKENLKGLPSNLARLSLSISGPEDSYLE
jgi:DNA repair exonuclease SbcCD ATPase subunit